MRSLARWLNGRTCTLSHTRSLVRKTQRPTTLPGDRVALVSGCKVCIFHAHAPAQNPQGTLKPFHLGSDGLPEVGLKMVRIVRPARLLVNLSQPWPKDLSAGRPAPRWASWEVIVLTQAASQLGLPPRSLSLEPPDSDIEVEDEFSTTQC